MSKLKNGNLLSVYIGQLISPTVEFASIPFLSFILTKNGMAINQAGTVVTVRSLLNLVGILVGGRLLPHFKAKQTVITCAFINAGTYFVAAIPIPAVVALALSINGLTLGLYYSFESELILNSCSKSDQAHVYSIIRTLVNIGGAVGPLIASVFSGFYGTTFFLLLGVVSLVYPMTLLTTYKVRNEVRNIQDDKTQEPSTIAGTTIGEGKSFRAFSFLLIALTIGTVSISAFGSVVPMLVNQRGGTPFSYTVGVWINTLGVVFCQIPLQSVLDKIGPKKSTVAGLVLICFSMLPLSMVTHLFWFYFGTVLFTLGELFFSLNASLLLLEYAEGRHAGEYLSLSKLRTYFASPIASAIGTFSVVRYGSIGYALTFSIFVLTSIFLLLLIWKYNKTVAE